MSSFTGLKTINATDINNQGEIRLTSDLEAGTNGQVIISQGEGQPAIWGSNSATLPNALTIGNNLNLTSGNTSFDGSIAETINAIDTQLNLTDGDGITITNTGGLNRTIETDNDEITISNSTGENKVLKTPGTITINQNSTLIDTFDGSTNKTINLEGKYTAGDGIEISGHTIPVIEADTDENTISKNVGGAEQLQVLKVPNDLTFTGYATGTFNGSSALNINLVDTDTTYQGGTGINIDTTTNPDTINTQNIPNSSLQNSTISGKSLGSNLSTITFYNSSGSFLTSYNGADPPTSVTLDGDTTYQGGKNISIDTSTNPDTINLDDDLTGIDSITLTSTSGSTSIVGNNYPSNPTTCSNLDLSSSTNIFPNFNPTIAAGIGGLGGIYKDETNGFLYRFLLPSDFLNDNDASGYARSVISDSPNHGAQQCYAGSQYYAFFTIPDGYYFSGFRVNLINSVGTPQGTTPTSSFYVNVYTKTINSNLSVVGTTKGFNTDNLGYTITSGYGAGWDINDPITIGAIHCFRNPWSSSFYNRGGWIQYTEGTPGGGM